MYTVVCQIDPWLVERESESDQFIISSVLPNSCDIVILMAEENSDMDRVLLGNTMELKVCSQFEFFSFS